MEDFMIKNHCILLTFLLVISTASQSAVKPDDSIIPNASYMATGNGLPMLHGGESSNVVRFHTATGLLLKTISFDHNMYDNDLIELNYKLDPNAPKPQPVSCKIAYWPAITIDLGFGLGKGKKGCPGDMIYFFDIHGNCISWGRYQRGCRLSLIMPGKTSFYSESDFDFSKVQESFSYQELRNDFKHQLFARQQSLIKEYELYEAFIEPYLVEAEKTLKALQYCNKQAATWLSRKYTNFLLQYNVACFQQYAVPNKSTNETLKWAEADLMQVITEIKATGQIETLNVDQELKNTIQLFQGANKAYYKKLSYQFRVAAFFGKYF